MTRAKPRRSVVVYTVVTGAYDRLRPARGVATWLCFTDGSASETVPWSLVRIPACESIDDRIRQARDIKLRPHIFLPPHRISVWVDANLELRVPPHKLAAFVDTEDMATFAYPPTFGPRDCAYQEATACIDRHKDSKALITDQMARYRTAGFPEHAGLAETSIVVRRDTPSIRTFCEVWWDEVRRGSRRDQLSFNFACWKTGSFYKTLPGSRVRNPFSLFRPHEQQIYGPPGRLHS